MNTGFFIATYIVLHFLGNAKGKIDLLTLGNIPDNPIINSEYTNPYNSVKSDALLVPESISQQDTTKDSGSKDASKNKGFIKKLFTSATKEEKEAKKEAKFLKTLKDQQVRVYGWHPYWVDSAYKNYDFNLLTTVSYFGVEAYLDNKNHLGFDGHGINDALAVDLIHKARNAGCRVDLTIKSRDSKTVNTILNNSFEQDSTIKYILSILESNYKIDGVCVVLEGIPKGNSASLLSFMSSLKNALKKSNHTLKLGLPPKDFSNNFNIPLLNNIVDEYVMMGYNYHHRGSKHGPVAPFGGDSKSYNLKRSVNEYLENGLPYSKFIVAIPYYGIVWKKHIGGKEDYSFEKHLSYNAVKLLLKDSSDKIKLDTTSYSYYFDYKKDNYVYRCYFDNDETLSKKYKWLIKKGLAGVGIWALGYDSGSKEFWKMFEKNFKVKKLPPLKKELIVHEKIKRDTIYKYKIVGDSILTTTSVIKDTVKIDTLLSQNIPSKMDSVPSQSQENMIKESVEKLIAAFAPLLANQQIRTITVITLIIFGLIGLISSLLFISVRELLYILSLPTYIFSNLGLILTGLGIFGFLGFLKADIMEQFPGYYISLSRGAWTLLILAWLIINLLSYRLLGNFSFKRDKP